MVDEGMEAVVEDDVPRLRFLRYDQGLASSHKTYWGIPLKRTPVLHAGEPSRLPVIMEGGYMAAL